MNTKDERPKDAVLIALWHEGLTVTLPQTGNGNTLMNIKKDVYFNSFHEIEEILTGLNHSTELLGELMRSDCNPPLDVYKLGTSLQAIGRLQNIFMCCGFFEAIERYVKPE